MSNIDLLTREMKLRQLCSEFPDHQFSWTLVVLFVASKLFGVGHRCMPRSELPFVATNIASQHVRRASKLGHPVWSVSFSCEDGGWGHRTCSSRVRVEDHPALWGTACTTGSTTSADAVNSLRHCHRTQQSCPGECPGHQLVITSMSGLFLAWAMGLVVEGEH